MRIGLPLAFPASGMAQIETKNIVNEYSTNGKYLFICHIKWEMLLYIFFVFKYFVCHTYIILLRLL